jgi:hypothetical protein
MSDTKLYFHQYIVTCISIARQRLGKHIPEEANARNNRTSIARLRINKHAFLTREAVSSACPCKVVIKKGSVGKSQLSEAERVQLKKSSFESCCCREWVEFWRWHSKKIENKWQEMN